MTEQDNNARSEADEKMPKATTPGAATQESTSSSKKEPVSGKTSAKIKPSSAKTENSATPAAPHSAHKNRAGVVGIALGAIAIAIALAIAGGVYHFGESQSSSLSAKNEALVSQLQTLQHEQQAQKRELEDKLNKQATALEEAAKQQNALNGQINDIQHKVANLSGNDGKVWLISQADFLVKLAGRKLWSEQDVTTAAALLKSADHSLSEMNDPSLIPVRRALTNDIASLSALSQVDYDGIILKLNQLSNNVDNLRLADNYSDDSPMDSDSSELSGSLNEWRENLLKSWHSFMDSFITIRRRDETAVPLLAPNQDIYLRENIRSRLLVAAQAVPRHQEEIYKQSLDNVSAWVRSYYDTNDAATKSFLSELDGLTDQNISMDVPQTLQSQPLLEKLVQTRVRNFLTQPAIPSAETPQSDGAETKPAPAATQGE